MNLRVLIGSIALLVCLSTSANAATLNVVGGQLVGASNVEVDGSNYNVQFLDGTCISLFSGCDEASDFTFSSRAAATLAAQALLVQVFIGGANLFDNFPELTNGCTIHNHCHALTPYAVDAALIDVTSATNFFDSGGTISVWPGLFGAAQDLAQEDNDVFAVWAPVPEPGTSALLTLGLVGLAAKRRRSN
jgi:hypothetical protein